MEQVWESRSCCAEEGVSPLEGFLAMLRHGFKEWAIICRLLADGRQAVILRKGGIAENNRDFQVEHARFWLYPTYVHQQRAGVRPDLAALLEDVETQKPPPGILRLTHFAKTARIYRITALRAVLALQDLHGWSEQMIRQRFVYRTPGLVLLAVRVWRAASTHEVIETAEYAGCRSWVELDRELPTAGASPVLDEATFQDVLETLDVRLH
jgi:hypothetical protein